tara:strand:- start:1407 stop:1718 length:312 start_codon:yes stop_codon:yes gene_type:complete
MMKIMETVWIHQPTGNVVLASPEDIDDDSFYEISIIGICDFFDEIGVGLMENYSVSTDRMNEYLSAHKDTMYYARPRDTYSTYEAAIEAYDGGFKVIIAEDLS